MQTPLVKMLCHRGPVRSIAVDSKGLYLCPPLSICLSLSISASNHDPAPASVYICASLFPSAEWRRYMVTAGLDNQMKVSFYIPSLSLSSMCCSMCCVLYWYVHEWVCIISFVLTLADLGRADLQDDTQLLHIEAGQRSPDLATGPARHRLRVPDTGTVSPPSQNNLTVL
jgi:hypothetical protein